MNSFKRDIYKTILNSSVPCNSGMDVAFIFDYTGSMSPQIEEAKSGAAGIINTIDLQSNNNYRLSLILADEYRSVITDVSSHYSNKDIYTNLPPEQKIVNQGAEVDAERGIYAYQWITAMEPFSDNNSDTFQVQLNKINDSTYFPLGGGGLGPEPLDLALEFVIDGANGFSIADPAQTGENIFRENVAKYVIIITDALPSGDDDSSGSDDLVKINDLINNCNSRGISVIVIGSGVNAQIDGEYPWRKLAENTGGTFNQSYDATTIKNEIISNCNS